MQTCGCVFCLTKMCVRAQMRHGVVHSLVTLRLPQACRRLRNYSFCLFFVPSCLSRLSCMHSGVFFHGNRKVNDLRDIISGKS
jgi:hypothetical protein